MPGRLSHFRFRRASWQYALVLSMWWSAQPVSAQGSARLTAASTVGAMSPAGVEHDSLEQRETVLEGYLCDLQKPARIYSYTWIGGLSALLLTQGTLTLTTDHDNEQGRAARTGYIVGTSMTGLGLLLVSLTSRPETSSCSYMRAAPSDTKEARAARLREGERRLFRAARAARRQTAWWMHGLGVLLGVGAGLGLGLGYEGNALRATMQGVGTFAFTELRIWTRPTRAIEYAELYEQRFLE